MTIQVHCNPKDKDFGQETAGKIGGELIEDDMVPLGNLYIIDTSKIVFEPATNFEPDFVADGVTDNSDIFRGL